jgi:hypothetical protein
VQELFFFMFVVSHFYALYGINDMSRGSLLGFKVHATFGLGYRTSAS